MACSGGRELRLLCLLSVSWIALGIGLNSYFAYYQSYAFWVMPYEWYDLSLSLARVYEANTGISLRPMRDRYEWRYASRNDTLLPEKLVVPHVDWDRECPSRRRPSAPTMEQVMAQVEQLLLTQDGAMQANNTHRQHKINKVRVVHVAMSSDWGWIVWRFILDSPTRSYNSSHACIRYYEDDQQTSDDGIKSAQKIGIMDSLGPNESFNGALSESQCIFFAQYNLEFRLISLPIPPKELRHIRNLLMLGQPISELTEGGQFSDPTLLHEHLAIGLVRAGSEKCLIDKKFNSLSDIHPRLRFAFLTYGDCNLVNNVDTFMWPLGVMLSDGFPSNFHIEYNPAVASRTLLLNLIASFTTRKPTRIQAYIAGREECNVRKGVECVLSAQGTGDSYLDQIDAVMSVSRSPSIAVALESLLYTPTFTPCSSPNQAHCSSSRYVRSLRSSIFTLCPQGNNPESYRAWEAIMSGSIPIIDEWPMRMRNHPLSFYHPAYGTDFACDWNNDVYYWIKSTDAPVLWIKEDWRKDLREILDQYRIGNNTDWDKLTKHQLKLKEWFQALKRHLQLLLISQVLKHMS